MNGQPPAYVYRDVTEVLPEQPPPLERTVHWVFEGITWFILLVLLAVWAVLGAFFWIPLMVRALLRFSLSLLRAVLVGRRPEGAARALRDAVSFYRRGFVVAIEVVTRAELDGEARDPETGNRLLAEVIWAIPVWYLIFFSLGWIKDSPVDLWNGIASFPWMAFLGELVDWVRP